MAVLQARNFSKRSVFGQARYEQARWLLLYDWHDRTPGYRIVFLLFNIEIEKYREIIFLTIM